MFSSLSVPLEANRCLLFAWGDEVEATLFILGLTLNDITLQSLLEEVGLMGSELGIFMLSC